MRKEPIMERTKGKLSRALRKKRISEALRQHYNKLKVWTPSKNASMTHFRKIPKSLIHANLSLPSLAVYPVICCEDNYQSKLFVQLSQENIKEKAGHDIKTIIKAIKELSELKWIKAKKVSEGPRHFWTYKPAYYIDKETGRDECFFFYTYLIESGIWSQLSLRAKVLYLALRCYSKFDFDAYCVLEGYSNHELSEEIKNIDPRRKWEICEKPLTELCQIIGMSDSNIHIPIAELENFDLIVPIEGVYKYIVYPLPNDVEY